MAFQSRRSGFKICGCRAGSYSQGAAGTFQSRRSGFKICGPITSTSLNFWHSFQSRRSGFKICGHYAELHPLPMSCFSPGDRDLGFAASVQRLRHAAPSDNRFSPGDRDLGFAARSTSSAVKTASWFQSRRSGFRFCGQPFSQERRVIQVRFSPGDRDLGFAAGLNAPSQPSTYSFSPGDRDLGFAARQWRRQAR